MNVTKEQKKWYITLSLLILGLAALIGLGSLWYWAIWNMDKNIATAYMITIGILTALGLVLLLGTLDAPPPRNPDNPSDNAS